ncbi:unnamed protein product, partial [Adineta steineri]
KKATQEGLRNEGWEYAPMFNMKFHADERSMDMTRRRRWHRKMVPSAEQNMIDASGASVSSTDVVFRMQSQVQAITDSSTKSEQQQQIDASSSSTTTTPTKDVKIELNAPRMYLSFKSKYLFFN